jgi:hypothetical protein
MYVCLLSNNIVIRDYSPFFYNSTKYSKTFYIKKSIKVSKVKYLVALLFLKVDIKINYGFPIG